MAKGLKIEAVNLNRILMKCDGAYLYGAEIREAMKAAVEYGHMSAQRRAPWKTGTLYSSITKTMDTKPIPEWGKVTTDVDNNGFRYPWALQASKRIPFHYKSTGPKGKLTRNWFKGVRAMMRRKLRTALDRAGRAIEMKWAA